LYFFLSAVFAPTDEAFAKLPNGALGYLLDNQDILTDVLLYHVISGRILSRNIQNQQMGGTLLGQDIVIRRDLGGPYCYEFWNFYCTTVDFVINDVAAVVMTDVPASNGIIHVINEVLIPPGLFPSGFSFPLDIVDTAIGANFETLVIAVIAAELVDALRGPGPFTVFAPSEEAWARLPPGTLQRLLRPVNKAMLTDILLYHVVSGAVAASTITNGQLAGTLLNGADVTFGVLDGTVTVNQATVIAADVSATNGIIHVIDEVLLPPEAAALLSTPSIIDTAIESGFGTLVTAVGVAGLVDALNGPGPFTVFAPTDTAFENLEDGLLNELINNPLDLAYVLQYHVVSGLVLAEDAIALDGESVTTLNGYDIDISFVDGVLRINDANVIQGDIRASNGVIHILDAVLIPPEDREEDEDEDSDEDSDEDEEEECRGKKCD
jgi:transforming growth factor-beta-induced protein